MIQAILLKESFAKVVLIYGNHDEQNIIYRNKLEQLKAKYGDKLNIVHVLNHPPANWTGATGLLSKDTSKALLEQHVKSIAKAKYYICGPTGMMEEVQACLKGLSVDKDHIHLEYFTAPAVSNTQEEQTVANASGKKEVTAWIDGKKHTLTLSKKENIIAAAIRSDVDAPYSCRTGACSSCKAKLISGKVSMDITTGLTDEELEEGYILCCQSYPTTNEVEIEFAN